ncbi:MAG TPA: M1 family metallopeptidase [Rhizomicrobium sp.]|nr:M1 family metallopeptidase [Rhizomicrobium sp.]
MNRRVLTSIVLLAWSAAPAFAQDRIVLPADVVPEHYDIAVVPHAADLTFDGHVAIDVAVAAPTNTIKLNAADLSFGKVALTGEAAAPQVSYDATQETATLTFASPVSAGHHVLTIDYSGKINQHAAGLFALDYDTAGGTKRALFTQFENSDARRFIPSWDEPARKATFTLTATVPANEMAVSNMPIARTEPLPGGMARVQFAQTPKMSSYLLFFGLGDFERISRKVNGVDVGVVFKRGDADKAAYALDAAAHILPYYEDYFGVKYPLPKLDLIAGPGQSQFFGAMENWGAIFYFERDLLIDPRISTQGDRRNVYVVVAHEMAHQWFGDLVTMDWWDGIWLNEGFASWMEIKATDHFHPEWHMWLDSLASKEAAMQVDARDGTHPIITPIRDVLQANEAFDTITYSKGQAVIRMLETYIGEDRFRAGVQAYIKAHEYGNTVTDDLWRELDKTAAQPITPVAHAFTLQAGVPLIRANATASGIHLTQDRFAADESAKAPTVWPVPVKVPGNGVTPWVGLVSRDKPADVPVAANSTPIVNAGQTAYFRTLYDAALFAKIEVSFAQLAAADQIGILYDSSALGYSGYAPLGNLFALARKTTPDFDPVVQSTIAERFQGVSELYDGLPGQAAFKAFGRRVLEPLFAKVGWTAKEGEAQNVTLARAALLSALSELDDPLVIGEAQKRFQDYVRNPSALSPELRRSVLAIVALHADAKTWDALHALAKAAPSALEKQELYVLLGHARDKALAEKALALAGTDEPPLTNRPSMIRAVSARFPDMAIDYASQHWNAITVSLEPDSRAEYVPSLAENSRDLGTLAKLHAFADAHIPPDARGDVRKADATIRFYAKIRAERLPELDRWLTAQPK